MNDSSSSQVSVLEDEQSGGRDARKKRESRRITYPESSWVMSVESVFTRLRSSLGCAPCTRGHIRLVVTCVRRHDRVRLERCASTLETHVMCGLCHVYCSIPPPKPVESAAGVSGHRGVCTGQFEFGAYALSQATVRTPFGPLERTTRPHGEFYSVSL